MATPCFYSSDLTQQHQQIDLSGLEASHAIKSRRLRLDDSVHLINGTGLIAEGYVSHLDRRELIVSITDRRQRLTPATTLTIATAAPKGDRQKNLVDMTTQLGVARIVPLQCERSVSKVSQSTIAKWRRVAIEACKQSQNPWLPEITEMQTLDDLIHQPDLCKVYAGLGGDSLQEHVSKASSLCIIIGPEGGFSPSELALLTQKKVPCIRLAPNILRTEAAAITATAHWVHYSATAGSAT